MEHQLATPSLFAGREPTTAKRKSIFDMIENPCEGWVTRKLHRVVHIDKPAEWTVELAREADGMSVSFEHESLFVAWARATEAVHMQGSGLYDS